MKILILDNYDSFTYNLVYLIEHLGVTDYDVIKNDKITIEEINTYDKILLSPGPGLPSNAGIMNELIKHYSATKSILGVCLGLQSIGEVFGGRLLNLEKVYHGVATKIKIIEEEEDHLFNTCPKEFIVGRYHSWVVDKNNFPKELQITVIDEEGEVMALKHKEYDVRGVQFHPESILSEYGETIMKNWISKN